MIFHWNEGFSWFIWRSQIDIWILRHHQWPMSSTSMAFVTFYSACQINYWYESLLNTWLRFSGTELIPWRLCKGCCPNSSSKWMRVPLYGVKFRFNDLLDTHCALKILLGLDQEVFIQSYKISLALMTNDRRMNQMKMKTIVTINNSGCGQVCLCVCELFRWPFSKW